MSMSARQRLREAAIPSMGAILVILFVCVQFLGTPPALGSLPLLAPADTSSPRATIDEFRTNARRATALLMDAFHQNAAEPGLLWSRDVRQKVKDAEVLLARAARTLDLSDIAPVDLDHRRLEATLLLKEILDRVPLPDANAVPGVENGVRPGIPSWNIPGTEIRIVRMTDGPRGGEYLFSAETVQQLGDFYRLIRDQPDIAGATADFYDFFSQSPGQLLPPKWYGLIEALPPVLRTRIGGEAVWQWIGLGLAVGLAGWFVTGLRRLLRRLDGTTGWTSLVATVLLPGSTAVAAMVVAYLANFEINITGRVNDVIGTAALGVAYLSLIWGVLMFSHALAGQVTLSRSESIDAHLARAAVRVAGMGIAILLLVYGASYLGIPLAGLLAGLGVGGLAVALAAKPTLENFIGGLILYADRPVRVGDLCRFGSLEGRVQEIGIRSTRIRGRDRSLITIPNATFVNMNIINLTNRDRMPYVGSVVLSATDSSGIRGELEEISAIVARHPEIEPGSVQVRLRDGHEEKPRAEIQALVMTSQWAKFLQVQQEVDLELRDAVPVARGGEAVAGGASNVVALKDAAEDDGRTEAEGPKASTAF